MTAETIPALLRSRASQYPDKEAIVDTDGRITYADLETVSAARATALVEAGVNKGHRVGLLMPNGVEWAIEAYAVMRIGAVLVPFSTLLRPAELQSQLAVAGVRHLISAAEFYGRNYRAEIGGLDRAALPSLRNIWFDTDVLPPAGKAAQAIAVSLADKVRPADEMAVIFTSGSSGDPKGVIHTHGAAIRANATGNASRCLGPDSRLYLPMPLFWTGGFAGGFISALNAGATLLTEAVTEPSSSLQFLSRERVTLFRGWPDQAERLSREPAFASTDLSSLKPGSFDALMPGESPPPGARARLLGMTESFGPYAGYALDELLPEGKWGSCGKPYEGRRVRIADLESGAILGPGKEGTIQIGGPNIMKGICGREREDVFTADGWFDTGDMGHLDEDGFLFISGRLDDMVKVGGATAYPSEVVKVLEGLIEIERAFVCDIEVDGETRFGAAVLLNDLATDPATLAKGAKEVLSAFKLPKLWLVLDALDAVPLKPTGKIDKPALRTLIETQGIPAS